MAKTFGELKIGDTLWLVSYAKRSIPELIELTVWCNSKMLPGYSDGFCKFYYKYLDKKSKYSLMVRETGDSVLLSNGMLITINREKAIEKQKDYARTQLKRYLEHVEEIQDRIEKLLMIKKKK